MKAGISIWILALRTTGETVEKVPNQILGGDAEKNDFTECTTINDLTIMKGIIPERFSTVSEGILEKRYEDNTYYSTTQGNPENQRLSVEICMKKAEPFLLMGDSASVVDL